MKTRNRVHEADMQKFFWQQAEVMTKELPKGPPQAVVGNVGAELELFLFCPEESLVDDSIKQEVMLAAGPWCGYELGASVVEIHPGPVDLRKVGFLGWFNQLNQLEDRLHMVAASYGLEVGRCGTVPWVSTRGVEKTDAQKYNLVPAFHDQHRPSWSPACVGGVFVGEAAVVGLLNAFQFSLESVSVADALDKINRLLMISPMAVALSANARVLGGKDTGWADVRFEVWRRSHDTRNVLRRALRKPLRIGLPRRYYCSIEEYLKDVASFPFIIHTPEAALSIGIGLFWRDARIKFLKGKLIVEFRPLSTQPTLKEDLAVATFVIGRLLWSQARRESLLPMNTVWENKHQAEKLGLYGKSIGIDGEKEFFAVLEVELIRAEEGLRIAGLFDKTAQEGLAILRNRVQIRKTPSEAQVGTRSFREITERQKI